MKINCTVIVKPKRKFSNTTNPYTLFCARVLVFGFSFFFFLSFSPLCFASTIKSTTLHPNLLFPRVKTQTTPMSNLNRVKKDDPFLVQYKPSELKIASEFLTTWLPFLSRDLCHGCTQTLSQRIRSLGPGTLLF